MSSEKKIYKIFQNIGPANKICDKSANIQKMLILALIIPLNYILNFTILG